MNGNLPGASTGTGGNNFSTTRWSLILSCVGAADGSVAGQEALAELCRTYWRPIFAYICSKGRSTADAQDLTQDFFVMVLNGNFLKHADPARGRFRSLLFKSVLNFLVTAHDKQHRLKRGGHMAFVSWDDWMAEAPSRLSVPLGAAERWPAEKLFDYRWAATVAEQALRRLGEECEAAGRRRVFDVMSRYLTADRADVSYPTIAAELGLTTDTVKQLLHKLRARYRELLREEVANTVEDPTELEDELRYLCAVLAAAE